MTNKLQNRIILIACIFVCLVVTIFTGSNLVYASATSGFEEINVLTDLSEAEIVDEDGNLSEEYIKKNGEPDDITAIYLVEWCYGNEANYCLYLYVYNPTDVKIKEASSLSTVQLGIAFSGSHASDYGNFGLKYINSSSGMFIKYKVDRLSTTGKDIINVVSASERRYAVSEIQLELYDSTTLKDYDVSTEWIVSGYAEGLTDKANYGLDVTVKYLPTVSLDVGNTYYRTGDAVDYVQDQVDSVYFSIPDTYETDYGSLKRIKAEWYEYKTIPIVVTSDEYLYNYLAGVSGAEGRGLVWGFVEKMWDCAYHYQGGYNVYNYKGVYYRKCDSTYTSLPLYFSYSNLDGSALPIFNLYGNSTLVTSSALKEALYNGSSVNLAFFEDSIDDNRVKTDSRGVVQCGKDGISYYDFDIDEDTISVLSYSNQTAGFWDNVSKQGFWDMLFNQTYTEETTYDIFVSIKSKDIDTDENGTISDSEKEAAVDKYIINYKDVETLYNACKDAEAKEVPEHIVLFRFAVTDYYCSEAYIIEPDMAKAYSNIADVIQETVFLDFDIIQLTFNKVGTYTVIPVVSDPIDIIDELTGAVTSSTDSWLQELLRILMLALLCVIIIVLLPYILKLISLVFNICVKVVSLPLKLIKKFSDEVKTRKRKRHK